jgi:hypothetical protein
VVPNDLAAALPELIQSISVEVEVVIGGEQSRRFAISLSKSKLGGLKIRLRAGQLRSGILLGLEIILKFRYGCAPSDRLSQAVQLGAL